ncbi:MAG TPA: DEAD/DEAH box helicase [Candidatus Izemoplasmatales bacterium]|nr:DEAD/DEAH box helicase [Candidatus Izemoplasmatales bacterium]
MKKFEKQYLNDALAAIHFNTLTDVQKQVIDLFHEQRDMIVEAKTGSGKSHAFLLPILESLDEKRIECQSVIIAPTRELALQIERFARALIKHAPTHIQIDVITGGTDRDQVIEHLTIRQPHIVIGTPGRIHDLVFKENILKIYGAKTLVIDEADMALDHHFIEALTQIMDVVKQAQTMVFSATIPESLKPFLRKYLNHPATLNVHPQEISNLNIDHYFVKTKERPRLDVLNNVIEAINPYLAIVFCNTKASAEVVYQAMKDKQLNVTLFHGGLSHRQRKQLIQRINRLDFQYVVATDLLARGIDILGVSHVINYELPKDHEFYIHRTGRTGRVKMDGIAISLYEFNDHHYLDVLEAKGIYSEYKAIKNKQIVDAKDRTSRDKYDFKEKQIDRLAKNKVKKSKKVKPGYKKKYKQKVAIEKKKLYRKMKK